jgi:hypothetical protein
LRARASCVIVPFGKGGEGPGTETTPAKLELNPAVGSSHEKETNHGQEEKEKEDGKKDVMTSARASYWGAVPSAS